MERLRIYDVICDLPEPRSMLVHVNHSQHNDERHSTLLNPPQTPAVWGRAALGLTRASRRPHTPQSDGNTTERTCVKPAGGHILMPRPLSVYTSSQIFMTANMSSPV